MLNVTEGYDDNVLADQQGVGGGSPSPLHQVGGFFTAASASLNYARPGERVGFGASGGATYRYYRGFERLTGPSYYGGAGISTTFGKTAFALNQSATYSPLYYFGVFPVLGTPPPGQVPLPSPDSAVGQLEAVTLNTNVSANTELSSRSSLEFQYDFQTEVFSGDVSTVRSQHASAGYRRSLTRNAGLRIGYGYREGRYSLVESGQGPTRQHDLDIGVDYRRSLSLTRRVTFGFSTGSAIIQTQSDTHYRVVGNASLNAAFKRTWNANLTYDRGVEFVGGFEDPFFSDSLIASVGGLLSPRLSYRGTVSYSLGSVGLDGRLGVRYRGRVEPPPVHLDPLRGVGRGARLLSV